VLDDVAYAGVTTDAWNQVGKAQVYYASPGNRSVGALARVISATDHDVLYLNSFFDSGFTQKPLWARMFGMLPVKPVVIAPRGEFSLGALALHSWKKSLFIYLASVIGLYRNVTWQASCAEEAGDISNALGATEGFSGRARDVVVAIDLPQASAANVLQTSVGPAPHTKFRIVFLSRITPKKNLDFALRVLANVRAPVEFNIYGPIREESYWKQCQRLIEACPANISVRYWGSLAHKDVLTVFGAHDLFFLPTRGENYGHVMMESLSAGTPILIANTTPWRNLEQAGAGWDLPLDEEQPYADKIEEAARMSDEARGLWRARVLAYATERRADPEIIASNKGLFFKAIGSLCSGGAQTTLVLGARKVMRYIMMYGVARTWVKLRGRNRPISQSTVWSLSLSRRTNGSIGIIGCGQFSFSTIVYFIRRCSQERVVSCFDLDPVAAKSFAIFHGVPRIALSIEELLSDPDVKTVYIASNHASHADYACRALECGKVVYVEKPLAVTVYQLAVLHRLATLNPKSIFAGYNRPFSGAVRFLRPRLSQIQGPMTLSCVVSCHRLGEDHWYRHPNEGTRICGNAGHWLDLAVHLLSIGNLPDRWKINLTWSDVSARDDDISICLKSERGDLVTIILTSRTEPFEGINETIVLQWGDVIANIDDFRRITILENDKIIRKRFWPKDVGHQMCIMQPYLHEPRCWTEVVLASLLMLKITDMVVGSVETSSFSFSLALSELEATKL
jgi:predicted dehydrogenase/glycosyltransferase involved in cell wall biosynthesis